MGFRKALDMAFLGLADSHDMGPVESVIGCGAVLHGNLSSKQTVYVDGELFGNIVCEDGIIVGETGAVHGLLSARVIVVCGKVKGNLAGSERVKLYPSGEVVGDIVTPDLSVDDGAVFVGSSRMKDGNRPAGESPEPKAELPLSTGNGA